MGGSLSIRCAILSLTDSEIPGVHVKMTRVIFNGFLHVTMKVLNSYVAS